MMGPFLRSFLFHGTSFALDASALVLVKQNKIRGVTGVHVDGLACWEEVMKCLTEPFLK